MTSVPIRVYGQPKAAFNPTSILGATEPHSPRQLTSTLEPHPRREKEGKEEETENQNSFLFSLQGLSKKDKEETQRVIASCERQKDSRLIATCRAPITSLKDIVQKASSTSIQNTPSSRGKTHHERPPYSRSNSATHTFNPLTIKLTETSKKRDPAEQPPTSPIQDFPDKHDELPSLEQFILPDPRALTSNNKANEPIHEKTHAKKEWLDNLKKAAHQTSSTNQDEVVNQQSESDSDLDIVDQPTLTASLKDQPPGPSNHTLDPFKQRLTRGQVGTKLSKPIIPTLLPSSSKAKGNTFTKDPKSKGGNLMSNLLAKSALDSALIREKKRVEYIERGGRVTTRELAMASNHTPSEIDAVNVKAILQENRRNADSNPPPQDEDDLDYDWDEVGSIDEAEMCDEHDSEEEISQDEDDPNEDQVGNCKEDTYMINGPPGASGISDQSLSASKTDALMPPPPLARCSISSSSSGDSTRTLTKSLPPGQASTGSKILAPNSISTDRDSCRGSQPPVSDPSETGEVPVIPGSCSPVDLPGFNFVNPTQSLKKNAKINESSGKNRLSSPDGIPTLTGFGNVECSGIDGFSDSGIQGFNSNTDLLEKPLLQENNNEHGPPGFSQLFDEDDGDATFTHPPPLLKPKKIRIAEEDEDDDDDLNGIDATCVLPAVNVLPEEKERDMMMMVIGAQDTAADDDEQPSQYVNHRGLLTQNKPNGPPDSPMMSQDPTRTPFALRKQSANQESQGSILTDADFSPTKRQGARRQPPSWKIIRSPSPTPAPDQTMVPVNAFTKVMNAQKEQTVTFKSPPPPNKKARASEGAAKMFLADEADESEDEYEGLGRRRREGNGSGSEDEKGSDDEGSLVDLVNDGEDERDEQTRLEGNMAHRELAKKHEEELEQKRNDHIQKIVAGKVRMKQARLHRSGDGGVTDSDSEDEAEKEILKANKRAQEHAAKKKKRAIHHLGHSTRLMRREPIMRYLPSRTQSQQIHGPESESHSGCKISLGFEDQVDGKEGVTKKGLKGLLSSPTQSSTLPFKITNHRDRSFFSSKSTSGNKTCKDQHEDLDDMYDTLKSTKDALSERQRLAVSEMGIGSGQGTEEHRGGRATRPAGPTAGGTSKTSSVTFHHFQQQQSRAKNIATNQSLSSATAAATPPTRPASKPSGKLARLKQKHSS
ncbi:hypothetical protein VP01_351g2 [Puccinia sorghi]|uniref:DNA replication checkpoint mediator MRC1 domain-containing protein n=1 Tax=Puccinia sorghi TaxID=27349 RepID=A0A0L6UVP5_9BASI|nr:hypothetical protein VP01_351g2 [Puccinia sorghi]